MVADRFSYYYKHTLDAKGRLFLPAKFRNQLGDTIAMMRGNGPCIRLYSMSEWQKLNDKYANVDEDETPELFDKMRKLISTSMDDIAPDKQSRILLHPTFRAYAKLDKDVIVAGMGRHVEIWDKKRYYEFAEIEEDE